MSATAPGPGAPGPADAGVDAVFTALADPTRRHVVRLLTQRSSITASGLAERSAEARASLERLLG